MGTPDKWGPPLWREMHRKTFAYPESPTQGDRVMIHAYFHSIVDRIPCPSCRTHYKAWLGARPVGNVSHDRDMLIEWLTNLHNRVNERTGKRKWSYEEVRELYALEEKLRWLAVAAALVVLLIIIRASRGR